MGGGGSSTSKGNGSSSRGRSSSSSSLSFWYGLVLLLAFMVALLGVMVVHKLREKRIFNLIVKDKDHQITSLHLLLQREREYSKDMKRKAAEMNQKIYFLRTQKMELERKVSEIQSTVDSLKEEHKALESALEEKLSEIKMLRERDSDSGKGLEILTETLKHKESEIQGLKQHLQSPIKVWSVSTDDPSNPLVNSTEVERLTQKDEKATTIITNGKEESEHGVSIKGNMTDEAGSLHGQVKNNTAHEDSSNGRIKVINGEKEGTNITNKADFDKLTKTKNEGSGMKTVEYKISDGGQIKVKGSDNSVTGAELIPGEKHEYIRTGKVKQWGIQANSRLTNTEKAEDNGVAIIGNRRSRNVQDGIRRREESAASIDGNAERKTVQIGTSRKALDTTNEEDMENKIIIADAQRENDRTKLSVNEANNFANGNVHQNINSGDDNEQESKAEESKVGLEEEGLDNMEIEDVDEQVRENLYKEFVSDLEEDKEEYKEEIDESEF